MSDGLSHFDQAGRARMVDVSGKAPTQRRAVARGEVRMHPETLARILDRSVDKGDVFGIARTAAILAAKQTSHLIPLCHPLPLAGVTVDFTPQPREGRVEIEATVQVAGATGVEMEALTAVAVAGLTIYDMCKAIDREMVIGAIRLQEKTGGSSGHYRRPPA